jgi:hyperosmotically inducible protein
MTTIRLLIGGLLLAMAAPAWAQPPSSTQLKREKQIQSELQHDPDLKDNHIDVTVQDGVVILKGKVDSTAERTKAERLARVQGVVAVDNQIEVGSDGVKETLSDTAITTKLKAQFLADDVLRHADIAVSTVNGVVTLGGTVPSLVAHARAVATARKASGVRRVEDELYVNGRIEPVQPR